MRAVLLSIVLTLAGCAVTPEERETPAQQIAPGQWDAAALTLAEQLGCERMIWQLRGESAAQVIALYSRSYVQGDCIIMRPTHGEKLVWFHYVFPVPCVYLTTSLSGFTTVSCEMGDLATDERLEPLSEVPILYVADNE